MKILVFHQYYLLPGQSGGGSRFNEMARFWVDAGHDVHVIAGTMNYLSGQTHLPYRGVWIAQEQDGLVTVWRCHVPSSYNGSYIGKLWAFIGFSLSAASAILRAHRPDVIIATSPPLFIALPGWIAARLRCRRIPWVFEVRDLWPESIVTMGTLRKGSILARCLFAIEQAAYSAADRINVLTPAFRENILARKLAPESKIVFIPNGADLRLFTPGPRDNDVRREFGWGNRTVLMYAGAHGPANAIAQLLDAAQLLQHRPDILICTVGDGPERRALEERARVQRIDNVMFCGHQPKERMPDFINAADVGCAVLQNNPTFRTVYPNKVFDYMACERPVLLGIDGAARKLVCDEAQAGLFAEPENDHALAKAILALADAPEWRREMGANGLRWVTANASRERLAARYLSILSQLANDGPRQTNSSIKRQHDNSVPGRSS